jgi:hypothetical protein
MAGGPPVEDRVADADKSSIDSSKAGCLGTDIPANVTVFAEYSGDLRYRERHRTGSDGRWQCSGQIVLQRDRKLCPSHQQLSVAVFDEKFPASALKLSKTKTSDTAKYSGDSEGISAFGDVTVPISFKLQATHGTGTLIASGLGVASEPAQRKHGRCPAVGGRRDGRPRYRRE